ncbi:MAG TPA: T9SS type A sorting domain-containing protein [Bacteroidales bacterium]|nr:T9SS type A sorting domain-containing protein [Bacteroidales bacterium]
MKRITTVLGVCVLLVFFSSSALAQKNEGQQRYQPRNSKGKSEMGISGALEYYKLVRGTPEISDIVNAHKAANQLPKGKAMTWSEIGPDNIAGRTRALLIDRFNTGVLYAGGVSGGLWQSLSGGTSWHLIAPLAENYAVSCITQDINGIIYFGTGEGFGNGNGTAAGSTGFVGGGVYKSTDATGTSFSVISSTVPTSLTSDWIFVYEMAAAPNSTRIYACTDGGLFITDDGGTTWVNPVIYPSTTPYGQVSHDVEVAPDGSVYAVVGDKVFYSPNGNSGTFVDRSITGTTASSISRVEIAVAPSDPNYIYASVAKVDGSLQNIYRSIDAGQNWTIIGPGGSDLFQVFGSNNQGYWDNIIKVFPNDKNHILVGGVDLWEWTDGGTWLQKSLWYLNPTSAYYLHADHHDIVFHPTNSSILYHGSDGGVSKSIDGAQTFSTLNRRFGTVQFYHLSCNPFDMVMGGTQDNGTLILPGNLTSTGTAYEFLGGDGGWSAMSYIDPNVVVGTVYYGDMYRSDELGNSPKAFYSEAMNAPEELSSAWAGFVTPMYLDEQINDLNSPDSMYFFNTDTVSIPAGTSVVAYSKKNNNFPFYYTIENTLAAGDSVLIQDRVQARFYIGLNGAVWMTKGLHDFSGAPAWYKVANISGTAQCFAGSKDGNYLYVGTNMGNLYRISNLSAVKDSLTGYVTSTHSVVECTRIASTSRAITSISVDPSNPENILYTLGMYGKTDYVYYSTNALDSIPTFVNKTGNLPKNPVYASIIEMSNSDLVIVGTELGIFSTSDIGAASVSWVEDNETIGRVPVYSLVQQIKNYYGTNNYGVIYAGTHGRGAFKSTSYLGIEDEQEATSMATIGIYPNPAETTAILSFNSDEKGSGIVNVYTIDGKLAASKQVNLKAGNNLVELNVSGLESGNYLIEVRTNMASVSGKLIKK